jgi:tRNA U38,U39,U40 pseudouridine synthase TruA
LFRHISQCSDRPQEDDLGQESTSTTTSSDSIGNTSKSFKNKSKRDTVGIRFAYFCNSPNENESESQIAGRMIQHTLQRAMKIHCNVDIEILSSTQASVANQRHRSLSQEMDCAAENDVMTISFSNPAASCLIAAEDEYNNGKNILNLLSDEMNSILLDEVTGINIQILEISNVSASTFHAENSSTQYVYHYLLPIKWLTDGAELERWWLLSESENDTIEGVTPSDLKRKHPGTFRSQPPSASLKILRNALKSVESITVPNRRVRRRSLQQSSSNNNTNKRTIERVVTRKLGTLSNKERRAWHNFADPRLQGDASPNQEPVWRVIDRCRIAEITKNPYNDEVVAILEFRGDAFLPQQIRRIVGTAVCITNGLIPQNTFDIATRPDIAIMTALAPPGRLYLKDVRFHFDESNDAFSDYNSKDNDENFMIPKKSTAWLQQQIFSQLSMEPVINFEENWCHDLERTVAPQLKNQISRIDECYEAENSCEVLDLPPNVYEETLGLLRALSASGWPDTSIARSKVIKNLGANTDSNNKSFEQKFGSFTVVNPKLFSPTPTQILPLGNKLHPDLVKTVFELEEHLCKTSLDRADGTSTLDENKVPRKPSSHCAVNFNASFTPHVDSGTGLGQSLSMIVGLGDYKGGEILVEGNAYRIRYQPLEFDGWKQRHWTGNYAGERFSLVWFTPETKDGN